MTGLLKNADLKLFFFYILLCAVIILRVNVEATGYQTPDSRYYLELAQNLIDGKGFYRSAVYPIPKVQTPENQVFFSAWPVGYPVMVFLIAKILGIKVWVASKIVNLICLGFILLLIRQINRKEAVFLALILCSFTFLEIYSYTWSEAPFLLFLLWYCISLSKYLQYQHKSALLQVFLSALGMFLCRYVGAFSFIILGLLGLYKLRKEPKVGIAFICISILLISFNLAYFYNNYIHTGDFDGGDRIHPHRENLFYFLWLLFKGLFNELLIIRNYYFYYWPELLWWCTTIFQIIVIGLVVRKFQKNQVSFSFPKDNILLRVLFGVSLFYLFILIVIRKLSPFDEFDYRLLSPFSFLLFLGIQLVLVGQNKIYQQVKGYLVILFLASLLLNLPKAFIIHKLNDLLD